MIGSSYRSYTRECYLVIELIRQFYDETRSFRITGDTGKYEYIEFSNKMMQGQPIPPAYQGQELEENYIQLFRKPVYDIVVKPQKRSPYSKLSQNELAKELYSLGFFNPQLAQQTMTALELMDFDGIESVKDDVQNGQTLLNMVNRLSEEVMALKGALGKAAETPQNANTAVSTASGGNTSRDVHSQNMTYGERLAQRAKPDMSAE